MVKKIMAIFIVFFNFTAVNACLGPENVFGVRFNDQESIDVSVIERMGEKGINFLKEDTAGLLSYSFRSHFNPSIMVKIILLGDNISGDLNFIIDTLKTGLEGFPFDSCAHFELDWLVEAGIVEIARIEREKITQDYSRYKNVGIYWTKQDTLIPNNAIINKQGLVVMANRCGAAEAVVLPPQSLAIKTGIIAKNPKLYSSAPAFAQRNNPTAVFMDVRGRIFKQQTYNRKTMPCGILLKKDRNSGIIKRVVAFP
jgi:hypothetical protein